jgi:hypothetical protein
VQKIPDQSSCNNGAFNGFETARRQRMAPTL